eukprot:1000065-Karenia_brevis.AAC.1
MLRACGDLGPCPKDLTPAGAFEELRGASLYEDPQSTVVAFNDSLVSLPKAGSCPRPLAELYGTSGEEFVEKFVQSKVLDTADAHRNVLAADLVRPYQDPNLK